MRANWLTACELADAAAEVGDRATATALHSRLAPYADLFAVVGRGVGCSNATGYYLGRLAATLGDLGEAEARFRRAASAADGAGFGPYAAASLVRLGEVLAARGEPERARDALAEAIARAERLNMPGLVAEARPALRARAATAAS